MTNFLTFLEGLIITSEKAAQISRIIRLAYLTADGANPIATENKDLWESHSSSTDFKTLADVLCQSVIDTDLQHLFPEIRRIRGEENGTFQSDDSSNVRVQINSEKEATARMLAKALPDNSETVSKLSSIIHSRLDVPDSVRAELEHCKGSLNLADISIWIDPIDSTKEYVTCKETVADGGICYKGLPCVTVLIGAYNKDGLPVAGVVSRPFGGMADKQKADSKSRWENEIYWAYRSPETGLGYASSTCKHTSTSREKLKIATSAGEHMSFLVENPNYQLISPKGAGNKILAVVNGLADLYIVTIESNVVHRWDTCAGHAILKMAGGGIVSYKDTLDALTSYQGDLASFPFSKYEIDYRGGEEPLKDGIVAYSQPEHIVRLFSDLLVYLKLRTP
ncbi:inositol polyphosphate 1-phosphatase-like [Watersipora subatra]|uniref:inositol polyphosphate 1-phosphatase-like n=1 Tax=Watersipora subatra TaxID=2589382 RepID=UPI00355B6BEE